MKLIDAYFYFGVVCLIYNTYAALTSSVPEDSETLVDPLSRNNTIKEVMNTATAGQGISKLSIVMAILGTIWMIVGFFTAEWAYFVLLFVATVFVPIAQMVKPNIATGQVYVKISRVANAVAAFFEIFIVAFIVYHHFFVTNLN